MSQIGEPPDTASETSSDAYIKMHPKVTSEATYMNVIYNGKLMGVGSNPVGGIFHFFLYFSALLKQHTVEFIFFCKLDFAWSLFET